MQNSQKTTACLAWFLQVLTPLYHIRLVIVVELKETSPKNIIFVYTFVSINQGIRLDKAYSSTDWLLHGSQYMLRKFDTSSQKEMKITKTQILWWKTTKFTNRVSENIKGATELYLTHYSIWSLFSLIQLYVGLHFLRFLLEN